ncbi:MAG: hypothetical protein L3J54_01440 [Draconibacterium sp.]|nr:hypothetical protein [Draconibacterium sp.]
MIKSVVLLFMMMSIFTTGFTQNLTNEFQPNGRPIALIFANFHTTFNDNETFSQFQIRRAYFGYEYNFSKNWYGKLVLDVGNPGVGKFQAAAFLKNAYFRYRKDKLSASFGMISTTQFKVSEKIWGYRYILKSFQDAYGFNASADLGAKVDYKFAKFISADFAITNGEGYKRIERDSVLRYAVGITVKPIKNITARVYADVMGADTKQQSVATFLAYNNSKFMVAGEYNYQKNFRKIEGKDTYGLSFFSSFKPSGKIKIFARYDKLNSSVLDGENSPWQIDANGQYIIAGIEYSPIKGVKLAPNFRNWSPDDKTRSNRVDLFLNCEVKF